MVTGSAKRMWGTVLAAGALAATVVGCGGDDTTASTATTAPTTTSAPPATAPPVTGLTLVGSFAPADGFANPTFVSVDDAAGRIYVTDSDNQRIMSLALDGSDPVEIRDGGDPFLFSFHGSLGSADVAADGSLFVAESGRARVVHISADGTVLDVLQNPDPYGRLFSASVDRAHDLTYSVDDERAEIVVFDNATGTVQAHLSGPGDGPGLLGDPGSIEVRPDGSFWVADAGNGRAQHLDAAGEVLQVIGPFPRVPLASPPTQTTSRSTARVASGWPTMTVAAS